MNAQQFEAAIEACHACALACDTCASACLQEDDVKMMAGCVALDIDCAQICRVTAGFMARASQQASTLCQACADVCEACGEECGKHKAQHCQDCAQACRRCADQCRRVAGTARPAAPGLAAASGVH